jgi:hypothetical protein
LVPLLYQNLERCCPEQVPPARLAELGRRFRANQGHNLFLTGELLRLLALFERHVFAAVAYKGPLLAAALYGDPALRQFSDLDLLVRKQDIPQIKRLLIPLGYRPQFQLNEVQERAWLERQYDYNFEHPQAPILLELHWQVVPYYFSNGFEAGQIWERLEAAELAGRRLPHLAPADLLLALCLHGTRHGWQRLGWICDVAELLAGRPELEWSRLLALSGPAERALLLGLALAHTLLDAPLPAQVQARLAGDPVPVALAHQIANRLFDPAALPIARLALHLGLRRSLPEQAAYLLRLALDRNPLDQAPLPGLSYLVRPLRLLGRYGFSPLKSRLERCWPRRGQRAA